MNLVEATIQALTGKKLTEAPVLKNNVEIKKEETVLRPVKLVKTECDNTEKKDESVDNKTIRVTDVKEESIQSTADLVNKIDNAIDDIKAGKENVNKYDLTSEVEDEISKSDDKSANDILSSKLADLNNTEAEEDTTTPQEKAMNVTLDDLTDDVVETFNFGDDTQVLTFVDSKGNGYVCEFWKDENKLVYAYTADNGELTNVTFKPEVIDRIEDLLGANKTEVVTEDYEDEDDNDNDEDDNDNDEAFYEKICRAYINTMNLEWVTTNPENNDSVVHGYFANDSVAEKWEYGAKVTPENFKDAVYDGYTQEEVEDQNIDCYEYDTWEDFYEEYVKDNIAYDIKDIGLYGPSGYDFYISKEDLEKLGFDLSEYLEESKKAKGNISEKVAKYLYNKDHQGENAWDKISDEDKEEFYNSNYDRICKVADELTSAGISIK